VSTSARSSDTYRKRWLRASLAVSVLGLFFPVAVVSHEPVTTNVRFNKEIVRIINAKCVVCHSAGGIKSDIPLSTYEEARPWAKAIKEEVLEKRMPPYQAVKGFGSFHTDYGLSQRETDLIVSWVEGGAPKGEEKDLPPREATAEAGWKLGKPDIELTASEPVKVAAKESAVRCLSLPVKLGTDRWISGFEFRPGNATVVNRALFRVVSGKDTSRKGGSSACMTGDLLGTWVPGEIPVKYPADAARLLPAGSSIALEIEYRGTEEAVSDRSSLGVYFAANEPAKQVQTLILAAAITPIAAQAKGIKVSTQMTLDQDADAIGVRPRLFPYAQSLEARAIRPDGTSQVLVWSRNRRFEWEPSFLAKRPIKLTKGTRIEVVAYLDNSESNPRLSDDPRPFEFKGPLCEIVIASTPRGRDVSSAK
jgi:hypothetical protein